MQITVTVNGTKRTADVEPRLLLVHLIREAFGLTGTHVGCDTTSCGACTVLLDGVPVKSCTLFGVQADGRSVTIGLQRFCQQGTRLLLGRARNIERAMVRVTLYPISGLEAALTRPASGARCCP